MTPTLEENALAGKSVEHPDEVRPFKDGKGKMALYTFGDHTMGRGEFEPGWRWSEHVKPIAGTDSCQATHTGIVLEGRMAVRTTQLEFLVNFMGAESFCRPRPTLLALMLAGGGVIFDSGEALNVARSVSSSNVSSFSKRSTSSSRGR